MKGWLPLAAFLLAALPQHSQPREVQPRQARSREARSASWEVNLTQYRLQSFDRDQRRMWMEQQGVLFLTPEKVLVYQVNRTAEPARLESKGASGGAGNFWLSIRVFQAKDGSLIKSLDLPTNAGISQVLATREGRFLVRTGESIYPYAADYQPSKPKVLTIENVAPWENWQMQAPPSGAKVVLIHSQVFQHPELLADNTVLHDGQAKVEVQVVDADSLVPERSFRLDRVLTFWSPAETLLFSSNPAHSYSDGRIGKLDFDGHWSQIRVGVPAEPNICDLEVSAIDDQQVVLAGCGEFEVVSAAKGNILFSFAEPSCAFRAPAVAGNYLAVRCDRYNVRTAHRNWRPDRIEVFDLESHAHLLSITLQADGAAHANSGQGSVAVIDGAKMRLYEASSK